MLLLNCYFLNGNMYRLQFYDIIFSPRTVVKLSLAVPSGNEMKSIFLVSIVLEICFNFLNKSLKVAFICLYLLLLNRYRPSVLCLTYNMLQLGFMFQRML